MTDEELVGDTPYTIANNTDYISRSNKDRWADSYRLSDMGVHNAANLQYITTLAMATNRSEVILPNGFIDLEGAGVTVVNPGPDITTKNVITIIGQGPDSTVLRNTSAGQRWISIGNDSQAVTDGIRFEGFSTVPTVAMDDTGSVFFEHNTKDITYKDVIVRMARNAWSFGVGATATNNVVYPSLVNCGGTSAGPSESAFIKLGSGSSLRISGGGSRWNGGGGQDFIKHAEANWNWDGLYTYGQFLEQWRKYLSSTGKGLVNADWSGGQMDRADIFFQAEAGAGGSNRGWKIHDNDILGFPCTFDAGGHPIQNGALGIMTSKGQSTDPRAIENIMVMNNRLDGLSDAGVWAAAGEITVMGNTFVNCANWGGGAPSGGALIRLGQGRAKIQGNSAWKPNNSYGNPYHYAVQCDGNSHPRRKICSDNDWYDYSNSVPVVGTP